MLKMLSTFKPINLSTLKPINILMYLTKNIYEQS